MKRNFKLFVAVLVLAVMVLTLASCGLINQVTHKHEYSAEWSSDATNHWHAALCDDAESADLAAHTFVEDVCSVCGYDKSNAGNDCTHEACTSEVVKEATCTEAGEKKFTCTDCGYTFSQELAIVDHTIEKLEAVEPTCTENGLSKGEKCSVCGVILKAQTAIESTGHDFVDGECSVCGEADPNSNIKTYVFESIGMTTFDPGKKADFDTELVGTDGFFKIIYSVKAKVDQTSGKTWSDGYAIGKDKVSRLAFSDKSYVNDAESGTKNVIEINVNGPTVVTIWWICGGDNRQVAIYNTDGTILCESEGATVKNTPYLAELSIPKAGKYYIGNSGGGANWFIKLEAKVEENQKPTLNGSGTYSEPYVLPTIGDYTTDAAGLVFYQYTVPADGFVTLSSNWDGGSVWLKLGTDINTADDNMGEGSSLKYFALKDTVVYIGVSDYNEVAEAIPFKVSFDEVTLGSIENVVGSWKGDFASMFGSATVIYSISEDGTGTASMNFGFGPDNSTIDKVVVVDNNVIIYLTNAYGSPETHNYVYAETEDGNKTLTGGVGSMTGELTPYDGEVGGNEPKPEVNYDTVIVLGTNTLFFSADEIDEDCGVRNVTISEAGTYSFNSAVFVELYDADGNKLTATYGRYVLEAGDYTANIKMFYLMGYGADEAITMTVELITDGENVGGGEGGEGGDDEDEGTFIEPYDPIKDSFDMMFYTFDNFEVFFYYNPTNGTYYANVYADDEDDNRLYDLYFTYEATENDDGSYTLTLTYVSRPDFEEGTEYVDTVLGYDIVVVPKPVEE